MNNKYRAKNRLGLWCFGFLSNNNKGIYFIGYHSDINNNYVFQQVDEKTIGQFTGDLDIHGIEIYVGDSPSNGNYVEFSFGCFNINGDRSLSDWRNFEVIGNRYE